jgi:hypothetical protein
MTARVSATTALLLAAFPKIVLGQTSEEYAAVGQKLWDAFECGALAEYADKPEKTARLYKLGYDQGKTLLDDLRGGKVDQQARSKLPIPVLLMLTEGRPSISSLGGYLSQQCKIRPGSFWKHRIITQHGRLSRAKISLGGIAGRCDWLALKGACLSRLTPRSANRCLRLCSFALLGQRPPLTYSRQARTKHFQQCGELPPLRNRGLARSP